MNWISITKAVPDDRREVLAWGEVHWPGMPWRRPVQTFLGLTRYNWKELGGRFDCERTSHIVTSYFMRFCCVTHWCDVTGPEDV